ncbi:MAG: hypothetical protein J6J36_04890 [Clostridia bacterium]|nr:hypothetical protein [Clostridia bacterium]
MDKGLELKINELFEYNSEKSQDFEIYSYPYLIRKINDENLKQRAQAKLIQIALQDYDISAVEYILENLNMPQEEKNPVYIELLEKRLKKINLDEIKDSENDISYRLSIFGDFQRIFSNLHLVEDDAKWKKNFIDKCSEALDGYLEWYIGSYEGGRESRIINEHLRYILYCENPGDVNILMEKWGTEFQDDYKKIVELHCNKNYIMDRANSYSFDEVDLGVDEDLTIGTEIEINQKNRHALYPLNEQIGIEEWTTRPDATVPDGNEFISPPMRNTPEDMCKFKAILETLKETGHYFDYSEKFNSNASGQINIGLDYLDTAESILTFFELYGNAEEILYHIANPDGQITRQPVFDNSRMNPISTQIGKVSVDEDISRDETIRMLSGFDDIRMKHKKMSICIRDGLVKGRARLEWRMPNGSCEFEVWKANIKLIAKIVEKSKEIANIKLKSDITPEEEEKLMLFESLKTEKYKDEMDYKRRNLFEPLNYNEINDEKLVDFLDLIFEDENDKKVYFDRYYMTEQSIERTGTNKYYPYSRCDNPGQGFKMVQFERVYRSRQKVYSYDPETGRYTEDEDFGDR